MKIRRISLITGVERTLDLEVTQEQLDKWQNGMLSQIAFPNLSQDEREFIMTGVVKEEWEDYFSEK